MDRPRTVYSGKNLAILFLLVTTVTGGTVAWIQYRELQDLRASFARVDQPAAKPEISSPLEEEDRDFAPNVAPSPQPREPEVFAAAPQSIGDRGRKDNREARAAEMRALMERPDIQRLLALQQKSALDSRYAALFRNLSLTPQQLERFKELLVEKRIAARDVQSAAREQGMNGREDRAAVAKLVADTQAEIDNNIREALGEAGFTKYETFEKTLPQRQVVNQLEQRLSYSATPLTNPQSDQLVAILAASNPSATSNPNQPFPGRGAVNQITDATINQALGILAAPQIEALRQVQQEQQAQALINAAMRNRSRGNDGSAPSTGVPSSRPRSAAPATASRSGS